MNIQTLKALTWLGTLGVAGTLGWEVVDFLRRKPLLEQMVSEEEQKEVLRGFEAPAEPRRNLVDYDHVRAVFLDMDWTGVPPVETSVDTGAETQTTTRPTTPIASLLTVLVLQVDSIDPAGSLTYVKYTDPKLVGRNRRSDDRILRIGDRLAAPYDDAEVDAISIEGVRFVFDDGEREPEVVEAAAYPSEQGIVVVDQAIWRARKPLIIRGAPGSGLRSRPKKTVQIRRDEFLIGIETAAQVDRDFSRILSRDVHYRSARDKRTGAVIGVQITKVASGSIPAQHGLSAGEIVKSINGHRVTSVNGAVAYVKQAAETTNTWVVVFEKQGKEFTRTYKSPVN